jgi:hypothetical protein
MNNKTKEMEVLRKVGDIELNKGSLMANGLFNLSDGDEVSLWFDEETKDDLMSMTDDEFFDEARVMIELANTKV